MSSPLCRFSPSGVAAFADWMRAGARGDVPPDLLGDPAFSTPVGQVEVPRILFRDRYEFGVLLKEVLEPLDRYVISFDQGLWTWLAAFFFEQLAPTTPAGTRELRKDYAYILSSSRYFRHLVRMPWYLVTTHGERSRFLLTSIQAADAAPLSSTELRSRPTRDPTIRDRQPHASRSSRPPLLRPEDGSTHSRRGSAGAWLAAAPRDRCEPAFSHI